MTRSMQGWIIAAVHVGLVATLGAKLHYDRATRPRVWVKTAPVDPQLPIRGRYVSLQLIVETRGVREPNPGAKWQLPQAVALRLENGRLIAEAASQDPNYRLGDLQVRFIERGSRKLTVLDPPIAFFIPEHGPDPSIRAAGEELWAEVTLPRSGPPRPIQLGVKRGDGPIAPLEFR